MSKAARQGRGGADAALAALLGAGDHRSARERALEVLAAPSADEPDRLAARAVLDRTSPEPSCAFVAAGALALFGVVAVLGLLLRP